MRHRSIVYSLALVALFSVACGDAEDGSSGLLGSADFALTETSCPVHSLISSIEVNAQRFQLNNSSIIMGAFSSVVFDRDDIDGHCEDPTVPLGTLSDLFPGQYRVRVLAFDQPGGTEGGGVLINDQEANPQLDSVFVSGGSSIRLVASVVAASGDLVVNGGVNIDNESFNPPPAPAGCCCGGDLCSQFQRIDCLPIGGCFWDADATISDGVCAPCD